ncbi:MAG: pyridoxal 5'-phosphate synthase glutaminase subunit PdxT, partial [Acidimicrobiia bacterium]
MLALQGAFREHREVLDALGVDAAEVRVPSDLDGLDVLFLPGGESTTMTRLLETSGLRDPIARCIDGGVPVLATCAGLILLARDVLDG